MSDVKAFAENLHQRSVALVDRLDRGHRYWLFYWIVMASLACGLRFSADSFLSMPTTIQIASALTYALVIGAPVASVLLAFHWFRDGEALPQPRHRLALFGRWRSVGRAEAQSLPLYGVTGLMASLLLGVLLNIPVRTLEFLAAMPLLGASPPSWFNLLYHLMLVDVVLLTSLYAIALVAALRRVPLFPRLLAAIWLLDIAMQLLMANVMGGTEDLPPRVAAALHSLLDGNLKKVLISLSLWMPYLLLSKRVNLTFRLRVSV
jgi:hypothetical protein